MSCAPLPHQARQSPNCHCNGGCMGQGWWIGVDDEIVSLIDSRLSCTAFHACMAGSPGHRVQETQVAASSRRHCCAHSFRLLVATPDIPHANNILSQRSHLLLSPSLPLLNSNPHSFIPSTRALITPPPTSQHNEVRADAPSTLHTCLERM
jgi:hypothetical protein